ncbi:hypothetical protein MHBO_003400 [Bonamia ostreae]|uniref:Eukaryotic translation initiation factor 4E n=1 Tax=Bonamia ostreae TaxID=126728 RepID=A0ABV2AQC0_9EUKA
MNISNKNTDHKLSQKWSFWCIKSDSISFDDFGKNLLRIGSFDTVEDFWTIYTHIKNPDSIINNHDIFLFKENVKPMWEDPANEKGGHWTFMLKKNKRISECWEKLVMAVVGGQFESNGDLCGISLAMKKKDEVSFSIWHGDASNQVEKYLMRFG